jgi:predicted nucleic acid-binding protein
MNRQSIIQALRDEDFRDLEDSLQYYCAVENECDALVTINTRDFPSSSSIIEVLDPKQFVDKYIED